MRDEDLELRLEIDADGEVHPRTRAARKHLAAATGIWTMLPHTGELLVFQREGTPGGAALCGLIDAPAALTNVFNFIHLSQWTGTLAVMTGSARRSLAFSGGQLLYATSNLPESRLGSVLTRMGLVKEATLAAAMREVTPDRRLGAVLVDRGEVTPQQLYEGVRRQVEEIFYSTLLLRQGSWFFVKRLDDAKIATRLHLDTQTLLLEGLRRIDELSYFRSAIPSFDSVLVRRALAPGELLPPFPDGDAARLYDALELPRSVREAARLLHLGDFEATRAAFSLVHTGYAQVREQASLRRHRPTTIPPALQADADLAIIDAYNSAFARLHTALAAHGPEKLASFRQAVLGFLEGDDRSAEMFRGVTLDDDGKFARRQIVANASEVPEKDRLEGLQAALSDLLFFMLFVASDAITRAEEAALHQSVAAALSKLPR